MTRPDKATSGPDHLFDAIAALLEPGQREYFYQRMLYFRQLRPEDELLRIAEAMGFLALLIRETPRALAAEREQLAAILTASLASIQAVADASRAHQHQLEDRLTRLPADIAKGISPPAIAHAITESLRQQFVQSGLPATADTLTAMAKQIRQATVEFQRTADQLETCRGVAEEAHSAINEMRASLATATDTARWAVTDIANSFQFDYRWSIATLCGAALLLGVLLGFVLQTWRASEAPPVPSMAMPPIQTVPPSPAPPPSPKPRPSHAQ